jgi:hypothetical protein
VVEDVCAHDWATALENELDEQYSIPSHAVNKMYSRWLEVELPATRHTLNVSLTNIYGFVITLSIHDETGGLIKEIDLYSCVGINNLADTIDSIYGSYGE